MNRTLFSLAIIRTNWEINRKDYIENFVPLFATLIKQKAYPEISVDNLDLIKNDFKDEYGLIIPSNPILSILNRLSKKQYIIRESNKFIPNKEKLQDIDITKKSNQIKREFEHVVQAIERFIKDKHKLEFKPTEIEDGLVCYLKKHDLDLLFAAERNTLLPNINPNKKIQFLINEFIGHVFRLEPELFKFILNLTIGHALAATILYQDFNQFSGKFNKLNLFIDTPFVFNILGIHGVHKKALAEELITILRKENVKIFVLEVTNKEVTSNLQEALRLLERGKNDPTKGTMTYKACIENGFNENDVEQLILDLNTIYENYGIGYTDIPNYDDFRDFQIDEKKLYDTIIETYDSLIPKKVVVCADGEKKNDDKVDKINNTIFRDVQVLSGVYRYRLGNKPKTLKDCKYLFITTNSSLAHASRRFEIKENGQRYSLPTCLTDVFLGTLIWLHSPAQIEILSQKKIIADCYAALKPDEKIIAKYLDDVEKLKEKGRISDEQYILLRTHRAAINILENKTLGDINEFTSQTTEEVLDELIVKIKSDETIKYLSEKEKHEMTQKERDEYKTLHISTQGLLEEKAQQEIQKQIDRNKKIKVKSESKSKTTILLIQILLLVLFLISLVVIVIERFNQSAIENWIRNISWIILTISGVINIVTGFNVVSIKEYLLDRLSRYFENKIRKKIDEFN